MFYSMLFVQRGKEKLCSLNQARAQGSKARVFHSIQGESFSSFPAFTGLFLAPQFWVQMVPLGGCCSGLPSGMTQRRAAVLLLPQLYGRRSAPEEIAARRANGSAEDSDGQGFSPFSATWPEMGFNFVQRTYGSQGSICLIAVCSLAARQLQL